MDNAIRYDWDEVAKRELELIERATDGKIQ
jgi:hypothetical protein